MTDSIDGRAQGRANGPDRSSQAGEIPVDFLGISEAKVVRMTGQVIEATEGLHRIIEQVESSLSEARALTELHVPFSDDMLESVHAISTSVESMAKQVEQVSSACVLLSVQSIADMAHGLQKRIAQIAVAQSG